MSTDILIGSEYSSLEQLQTQASNTGKQFLAINTQNDLDLITGLFNNANDISVKKTVDQNAQDIFVFYENNEPKYYISENKLEQYYEAKIGKERELARETQINELMLKILLLKMYNEDFSQYEAELAAIEYQRQQALQNQTQNYQDELDNLQGTVNLNPTVLLADIESLIDFYKEKKREYNSFMRTFSGLGPGKKTLKGLRDNASDYLETLRNYKRALKKGKTVDLQQIYTDIQRYTAEKAQFAADYTDALKQQRVLNTSQDIDNYQDAKDAEKEIIRQAKYMQKYAKQLRQTGMRDIDIRQKQDFIDWLQKVANRDIDEIVQNGIVMYPFVVKYQDDYQYLCRTYPWIKRFINYEEPTRRSRNSNTTTVVSNGGSGVDNNNSNNYNSNPNTVERIIGDTGYERIKDAYSKGGLGGVGGQMFEELTTVMGIKNNTAEYHRAKKFIGTASGLAGAIVVGHRLRKKIKDSKVVSSIPVLKNVPGLAAVGVFLTGDLVMKGLTQDGSGLFDNYIGAFTGNQQSPKHANFLWNWIGGRGKVDKLNDNETTKFKTMIGDIPVATLVSLGIVEQKGSKVFVNYNALLGYVNGARQNGSIDQYQYEDIIKATQYFQQNTNQNLSSDMMSGLGINRSVLNDPQNARKTINELSMPVTGQMSKDIGQYLSSKNYTISGNNDTEKIQNRQRIEDYYNTNHNNQTLNEMFAVREVNNRVISQDIQNQNINTLTLTTDSKVNKTISTLGDYQLNQLQGYFSQNPDSFDIDAFIGSISDPTDKARIQQELEELKLLRDQYGELPEQILADGLLSMDIDNSEISSNGSNKVKDYYIQRTNKRELIEQKEKRELLLQQYEDQNYLSHTNLASEVETFLNDASLIDDADIQAAIEQLVENNPNIFEFDYRKDPYLRLNRDGTIDNNTETNVENTCNTLESNTNDVYNKGIRGVMKGIMEVANINFPGKNFNYKVEGSDLAVEFDGYSVKVDLQNLNLINFPVGSSTPHTFQTPSELLLTALDATLTVSMYKGQSTEPNPFKTGSLLFSQGGMGGIDFRSTDRRTSLSNSVTTEFSGKTTKEIVFMIAAASVGFMGGGATGARMFTNTKLLNRIAKRAGRTGGVVLADWGLGFLQNDTLLDSIQNVFQGFDRGTGVHTSQEVSALATVNDNTKDYVEYLNSLKKADGTSVWIP